MFRSKLMFKVLISMALAGGILVVGHADGGQGIDKPSVDDYSKEFTDIGDRRELFLDNHLIEETSGSARLVLHRPVPRELVLRLNNPWEGNRSGYVSVFKFGETYKMYYKASHFEVDPENPKTYIKYHRYTCYAESNDGINWTKPDLGIVSYKGSTDNNIIFDESYLGSAKLDPNHSAVFLDTNPDMPETHIIKAIVRTDDPIGLALFCSADGINFTPHFEKPFILATGKEIYDSQNLVFWDPNIEEYRAYWRSNHRGVRGIRTAHSKDFLKWSTPNYLEYEDSPDEHMYTNVILPYYRAPHILIGLPVRYVEREWNNSLLSLPEPELRIKRAEVNKRFGTGLTETLLMSSRDGYNFKRWNEAFIPPGIERPGTWNYGQNYTAWSLVETPSHLEGAPNELSFYTTESYWDGDGTSMRRYTLRMDGFVSVYAPMEAGTLKTKGITFSGKALIINFATSAAGSVRVQFENMNNEPISGFTFEDCDVMFGDTINQSVTWNGSACVETLVDQPIKIHFELKDAHIYSYKFE